MEVIEITRKLPHFGSLTDLKLTGITSLVMGQNLKFSRNKWSQLKAALLCSALLLSACGPMNKSTGDSTTANSQNHDALPGGDDATGTPTVAFSAKRVFVVHTEWLDGNGAKTQPAMGFNSLIVRFSHGDDLEPVSKDAQVTVQYFHVNRLHPPSPFTATSDLIGDGKFHSTVNLLKSGRWEIHIQLQDGSLQDEYVVKLKV